jgi:hypothetical protein
MYDILKSGIARRFLSTFLFTVILTLFSALTHAECVPQDAVPACLSGIAASSGYTGALIEQADTPGMRRVQQGDKVEDWTVGEIGPRYVVFNRGDETVRLDLTKDDTKIPTDTPAPEPSPGIKKGPVRHTRSLARGGS